MKRPLFVIGIAFYITTWAAFQVHGETVALLSAAAVLSAVLCTVLRGRWHFAAVACAACLSCAAALGAHMLYESMQIAPVLKLAGKSVIVEGLVTQVDRGPGSTTYMVRANFPDKPEVPQTTLLIRSFDELEQAQGDIVRCKAYLSAAPETTWYRSRGILLTGSRARNAQTVPAQGFAKWERALLRLRSIFERNVYAKLREQNADVVTAMVLGLGGNVSAETYSAVNRSGTSHLLSVSGLHLSMLAAFALGLLRRLRCPDKLSAALTILFCLVFTALVGFGASVSRSFVMSALTLSGRAVSRRSDSLTSLGLALLICSIAKPLWALGWGLWLSAASTLGIILFSNKCGAFLYGLLKRGGLADRLVKPLAFSGAVSIAAYTFTLPLLLLMSGWISLISPLANLLVAPFVPVVMLGGVTCALFGGSSAPLRIIALLTDYATAAVVRISELLGGLPFAVAALDESWMLLWLFGAVALAALLLVFKGGKRLVAYAVALCLLSFSVGDLTCSAARRGEIELVTLTGCDTALLLRGNEAVLIGTPDAYEISKLLKYLNYRNVSHVPLLFAYDCEEQVGSGVLRLAAACVIDCAVGPNDAYIVGQLQSALPNSLCWSGGYATAEALGGALLAADVATGEVHVRVGAHEIVKIDRECDIIESDGRIGIFRDGVILLPGGAPYAFEPLGAHLFGESRVLLSLFRG